MSASRRAGGGEDNILAKLERDAPRGAPGMLSGAVRVAWFGVAGLLILTLIGALAWLAHENNLHRSALAEVPARAPSQTEPAIDSTVSAAPPPAPAVAAIIDQPPERADRAGLVMLSPAAAPALRPAPLKPVLAVAKAAARPAAPRTKKAAPPVAPKAEPSSDDTDVALLSAIIMNSSKHVAERAQQEALACGPGKKCPPKAAADADD